MGISIPGALLRGAQLAFAAALIVVFASAVAPPSGEPPIFPWDKAMHFTAFYLLAALGAAAFPRRNILFLAGGLSVFGLLIELAQATPLIARDCSAWDWVADNAAIAAAYAPLLLKPWRAFVASRRHDEADPA